ncbi:MAG: transporter [Syntrophaceae bacterium]|nr:transporter [Syntrophaceae bacterium]
MFKRIIISFVIVFSLLFVFPGTAASQHFEATIPQGYWLEAWMMRFHANEFVDTNGHTIKMMDGRNLDLTQDILFLRPIYVTKYWIFDSHIPISRLKIDNFPGDDTSSGLGDVWLNLWIRNENADKKWRPFGINLAPGVGIKFPIGDYDEDRAVNLGSNQYDFRFDLRFSKFFFQGNPFGETGKWAIEGAVEYTYRFENEDIGIRPGNRLDWIIGPSVSIGKRTRIGWDIGGNVKERDETGSGRDLKDLPGQSWGRKISTGPTLYYIITPQVHLSAYALIDVDVRNEPKGSLYYLRWLFYWPKK